MQHVARTYGMHGAPPFSIPPPLPESTSSSNRSQKALVMWLVGFLIQLEAKHYISDSALNLLLRFLHIFRILGGYCGLVAAMATEFPSTPYRLKRMYTMYPLPYAVSGQPFLAAPFNQYRLVSALQAHSLFCWYHLPHHHESSTNKTLRM